MTTKTSLLDEKLLQPMLAVILSCSLPLFTFTDKNSKNVLVCRKGTINVFGWKELLHFFLAYIKDKFVYLAIFHSRFIQSWCWNKSSIVSTLKYVYICPWMPIITWIYALNFVIIYMYMILLFYCNCFTKINCVMVYLFSFSFIIRVSILKVVLTHW